MNKDEQILPQTAQLESLLTLLLIVTGAIILGDVFFLWFMNKRFPHTFINWFKVFWIIELLSIIIVLIGYQYLDKNGMIFQNPEALYLLFPLALFVSSFLLKDCMTRPNYLKIVLSC